ncbi:hypothetical protein [Streptomyces sp. AcH 505]|uniref:hypothetical protein n=1 Tax=Streptomyces sp. AcH 505 TaxID=352211 RepID=UPI000A53D64E
MDQPAHPAAEERPRCPRCGLPHDLEPGSLPAAFCASIRTDVKQPATETTALCAGCGHKQHRPGTECETRVDHGPAHFHSCLCLNLVDADRACPAQMTCQGGTLGYADIWYLQRGHSLSSAEGVITPNVLRTKPATGAVQPEPDARCGKCTLTAPQHSAACPNRPRPQGDGSAIQGSGYTPTQLLGGESEERREPGTERRACTGECDPTTGAFKHHPGCPGTERRVRYAAPISETAGWVRDVLRHPAVAAEEQPEPDTELTADEARDAVSDLGIDLYRAQDAVAFVGECCDIADRDGRRPTTGDVREWLKGARCGRVLVAGQDQPEHRPVTYGTPGVVTNDVQSCRSEEGITVGLVDGLISLLRVLAPRDLSTKNVQEALTDLREDPDLQTVLRIKAPGTDAERRARYGGVIRKWGLLDEVNSPDDTEWYVVSDLLAVANGEQLDLQHRLGRVLEDRRQRVETHNAEIARLRAAAGVVHPEPSTEGCLCINRAPEDYDGPVQNCPIHGDPAILGYDPHEWRERYAEAIRQTDGWVLDDGQHMLNAVVAVGAAEITRVQQLAQQKLDQAQEEFKAGLRQADEQLREMNAELEQYAAGDKRPVLWSVYNRMHGRAASAEAEAKSLRAELATTRKDAGWLGAARFLRRTPQTSDDYHGALRGARLIETELRRLADEKQPTTTGLAPDATRTNETAATVGEERSCGYGNPHPAHKYLRMEVHSQCPGVPDEATAWTGATELASDRAIAALVATGIVGYQQSQGRLLHCLAHKPAPVSRYADFHDVTADDLDDGGICVHPRCGRDLLIPWTPAAPAEEPTS